KWDELLLHAPSPFPFISPDVGGERSQMHAYSLLGRSSAVHHRTKHRCAPALTQFLYQSLRSFDRLSSFPGNGGALLSNGENENLGCIKSRTLRVSTPAPRAGLAHASSR